MRSGKLCATVAVLLTGVLPQAKAAPQVLKGHVPAITRRLAATGNLDESRKLDLAIGLPLRNREALTNLLRDLSDPSSANFRHYLTPGQFAESFGPSQQDYQAVIDFATAHGLTVRATHPNRTLVDVRGAAGDIEKAFHVHLRTYQHPTEARTFFAPDTEPSLDLSTPVLAISGLDDYARPRPQIHSPQQAIQAIQAKQAMHSPGTAPQPLGGGGSSGGGGGSGGSGPSGTYMGYDFPAAYAPDVVQDGSGQSVGLFELSGYSAQDISDYVNEAGLPGTVQVQPIYIDGFDGDDQNIDYSFEVTADIEMAISMAPNLDNVWVYEGPTPLYEAPMETNFVQYASTTAQINDVFNRMATDDLAKQLSCSYEMDINASTIQIYQQFAAQGQSIFQGSGDAGAYASVVDSPADEPYLTVVGGTTLSTGAGGAWAGETVWLTPASNDPLLGSSPEEASGGGVSLTFPIPVWQEGISMSANQGSTTMRNIPDVAMVANNVDVVWGNDYIGESFDFPEAGTSLSTPLWAAFTALANEAGAENGQAPIGFANPALYAIGKSANYKVCFHDVTTGNDFTPDSPSKYAATTGYDLCTGWGSPTGAALINALLAPPTENLVVTPPLGFLSLGPGGGPYSVTSETYTLKNAGAAALNWSLVNTSRWLSVSATGGALAPGATTTVKATLNGVANSFLIGRYDGNLSFVNSTDGTTQNRELDLDVGNGTFETGDLSDWKLAADTNLVFALCGDDADVAGTNALYGTPDQTFVHSGLYGCYLGEYPDNGYLTQDVATTPGERYAVSFWLASAAYYGATTPNDFTAMWNGSVLYSQTNLAEFGWTNMQYVVLATAATTTLEFSFNNSPAAFGLDDVRVEAVPAPTLETAVVAGNSITLNWSGLPGLSYQVQSTGDLSQQNWATLPGTITASNDTVSAVEPASAAQQFYRVILLPGQ